MEDYISFKKLTISQLSRKYEFLSENSFLIQRFCSKFTGKTFIFNCLTVFIKRNTDLFYGLLKRLTSWPVRHFILCKHLNIFR